MESIRGGIRMKKKKLGYILGVSSILSVMISIIIFFIMRGPNVDIYAVIIIYSILSIIGIVFSILSLLMSKRILLFMIGLVGNVVVLGMAFLLLLAMGISEP